MWASLGFQTSTIDDLLQKENCTVEMLLDDSDCLSQFKARNPNLLDYFNHQKISRLIDFITVLADEKDGASRGRLYPFLTDQIFSLEINSIISKFFQASDSIKIDSQEDELLTLEDGQEIQGADEKEVATDKEQVPTEVAENEQPSNQVAHMKETNKYVLLDKLFAFVEKDEK